MNIKEAITKFDSQIRKLSLSKSQFCNCPEKDFTRDRKLSFESTIRSILYFGGGTLTFVTEDMNHTITWHIYKKVVGNISYE